MSTIHFIKSGLHTTIQDLGRKGLAYYAIPNSGVMDKELAALANALVNNPIHYPLIECTLLGPTIRFDSDAIIALTGEMKWQINNQTIPNNTSISIKKNTTLKGNFDTKSLRSYIAIQGLLDVSKHFESAAAYAYAELGHLDGQAFKNGDSLRWNSSVLKTTLISSSKPLDYIPIYKGPEYHLLTAEAKEIFQNYHFKVQSDSNRMGARLIGTALNTESIIKKSVPILPGFIQITPSGQAIVILQDGQTTGGYPRIGYLKPKDLGNFNQIPFQQKNQFKLICT